MTLLILTAFVLITLFAVLIYFLWSEMKKLKKLNFQIQTEQKNHLYTVGLVKEIQEIGEYGKELEKVIDVIINSLDKTFKYSTISALFIKDSRLIFKTQVRETVSHAFVEHIKDNMLELLASENANPQVDESITGVELDNLSNSLIMSTFAIKLIVNEKTKAVINISSTSANLYKPEDMKNLTVAAEIASGFLTRLDSLTTFEKGKSVAIINSFSEGIFMIDNQYNMVAMNNSAANFLGIYNTSPTFNDLLSALPNTYNFKEKIEQAMRENRQVIQIDVPIKGKFFKIIITPVVNTSNKNTNASGQMDSGVTGVSILIQDTTLEKSLSQMKEDFTNIMVHELRSPLTAIRASSEFLLSQADLTPGEKTQLIQMISESSRKMLDEISLILDSAKLDAGLFAVKKTPADLGKLIMDRTAVFTPAAAEKSISIKVDIDPSLVIFSFDPIRIDEVVNNLLSNSLKFTPVNGTISITASQSGGKATVSVTDTGSGIPKDKQHLLFAKFQQAPTDSAHQGTGLGLYVVKGVVEAHGGDVHLVSEEGKGTTISFTLPVDKVTQILSSTPSLHLKPRDPMSN